MKIPVTDSFNEETDDEKSSKQEKPTMEKKGAIKKKDLPRKKKDEVNELKERIENITEELKLREAEVATAEGDVLRAQADTENFKKRIQREQADMRKYSASPIVEDLMPALDNFDKAMTHVTDENPEVKNLRVGVEMVVGQLREVLQRHGLKKIDVVGKPFDPVTSEAIKMEETTEHEEGIVIEEFSAGYNFKDRVIRHAKVSVAQRPK